jgi:ureidoglycolate lyase
MNTDALKFDQHLVVDIPVLDLTPASFAPYGTVIAPEEDGTPFGEADAKLDLSKGTPRFYAMRVPARGLLVKQITRHCSTTQTLASAGGHAWFVAVAPPDRLDDSSAEPSLAAIQAFRIPGDHAIMLFKGSWHAGPLFEGEEQSFFNLELADTNVVDHHTCRLVERYGRALRLAA